MLPLAELQSRMRDVALGGSAQALDGVIVPDGFSVEQRLNIHRNNTTILLCEALAATFKVCHKLVGEDFFEAVAKLYIRTHPPQAPCLFEYGAGFADFLETLAQIESVPYLPDVARLEWLWNDAFHAADTPALDAQALAGVAPEAYGELSFTAHPSLRLLASPYPIREIWAVNQDGAPEDARVDLDEGGQYLVVVRLAAKVEMHELDPAGFILAEQLVGGARLQDAFEVAAEITPGYDPATTLTVLLSAGAFQSYSLNA